MHLLLLAHGSKDTNWLKPFEKLNEALLWKLGAQNFSISYLELSDPSFLNKLTELSNQNISPIKILPLFMASGKHMKNDIEHIIDKVKKKSPQTTFKLLKPIGENTVFIENLAQLITKYAKK